MQPMGTNQAEFMIEPYAPAANSAKIRFRLHLAAWNRTRRPAADPMHQMHDAAYEQIMAMGEDAVPLILGEMARRPDHWFKALNYITQENPVPEEDQGNLERMTHAWLNWGYENDVWSGVPRQ